MSPKNRLFPGQSGRLSALHAASFAGIGISLPFFPVWLEHRALSPAAIGAILALPVVVRIAATAPLMALIDRRVGARALIAASCVVAATAYFALLQSSGAVSIAAIVVILAVAQAPVIPTSDLVTLQAVKEDGRLDYGRVRLWGSVAFLATSIGSGYFLEAMQPDAIIWLLAALAVIAATIAWVSIPPTVGPQPAQDIRALPPNTRLPRSLKLVIASAACVQASHAAIYGFGSLHWRDLGFSGVSIGSLWAAGVAAEIVVFAVLGRGVGRGSAALGFLMAGAAAGVFRFGAMALEPGLGATYLLQILHAVTFGVTHLGTMAALTHFAPIGARARAQGVLSSALALAMAGGTVASGAMFHAAGPLVFLAMVPLAAAGFLFAWLAVREPNQPHRAGEGG